MADVQLSVVGDGPTDRSFFPCRMVALPVLLGTCIVYYLGSVRGGHARVYTGKLGHAKVRHLCMNPSNHQYVVTCQVSVNETLVWR